MIYVTHDQVEAMTMGDRIAVFNKGHIEQVGPPMELYNQPANEFVATFLGAPRINLIDRPASDGAGAAPPALACPGRRRCRRHGRARGPAARAPARGRRRRGRAGAGGAGRAPGRHVDPAPAGRRRGGPAQRQGGRRAGGRRRRARPSAWCPMPTGRCASTRQGRLRAMSGPKHDPRERAPQRLDTGLARRVRGRPVDPAKWDFDLGNGFFDYRSHSWVPGWGNEELQYYTRRARPTCRSRTAC